MTPRETRAGTAFGSSQKLTCGKDGENGDLEEYAEWLEMSRWCRCVMMETKKGNKTEIQRLSRTTYYYVGSSGSVLINDRWLGKLLLRQESFAINFLNWQI